MLNFLCMLASSSKHSVPSPPPSHSHLFPSPCSSLFHPEGAHGVGPCRLTSELANLGAEKLEWCQKVVEAHVNLWLKMSVRNRLLLCCHCSPGDFLGNVRGKTKRIST